MRRGELSYSKVRALTRVATPENEEELLIFAQAGTACHVEKLVRAWRRVDRCEEIEEAEKRHQHRYARVYTDEDGMVVLRARLEPEVGAVVLRALEAAADVLYRETEKGEEAGEKEISGEQKRADALGLVAESALAGGLDNGTRGDRYQVVVHVDAEALEDRNGQGQSVLEDGIRVSAETSRRLACDAAKVVMTHDADGSVLDVGRKSRTIPPALRRALVHRDRSCRFPGCSLKFCDAHHIEHWAEGGKTRLDNLLLLCRYHHRLVHEGGCSQMVSRSSRGLMGGRSRWLLCPGCWPRTRSWSSSGAIVRRAWRSTARPACPPGMAAPGISTGRSMPSARSAARNTFPRKRPERAQTSLLDSSSM
jgi:hypothetical protein